MAKNEATLLVKIVTSGQNALKAIPNLLSKIVFTAGDVAGAIKFLTSKFAEFALQASEFKEVQNAFRNLANSQGEDADKMLDQMRKLSAGTVSDLELMKQANNALLLGLPVEKFGEMLNIARSASKATGQSMEFMLQSIVTGLGRGSKLILDNLGIVIDTNKAYEEFALTINKTASELTDAEKKQAFINKALEVGSKNAAKSKIEGESLKEIWEQLKTATSNLAIELGEKLLPAFTGIAKASLKVVKFFSSSDEEMEKNKKSSAELAVEIGKLQNKLDKLQKGEKNFFGQIHLDPKAIKQTKDQINELIQLQREQAAEELRIQDAKNEQLTKKADEAKNLQKEQAAIDLEEQIAQKEFEGELLAAQEDKRAQMVIDKRLKENADKLKIETDHSKKMQLLKDRDRLIEGEAELKKQAFEKKLQEDKIKDQKSTLSTIASLSQSNNKTLAAIGKAAGITQIAIDTPVAVAKAMAAFPPPINFVAAAAVGAAMAAQAARIAGVPLEDGGIVQARPGGVPAIIGEGGRDEAVIPLDQGGPLGNTINITINGGLLGDESSARELAIAIDRELFGLRQDNQSLAFDEAVI